MSTRTIGAVVLTAVLAILGTYMFLGGRASAQAPVAWQLIDGQSYEVGDFKTCTRGGSLFVEWHFGGRDRSIVAHQTPGPASDRRYFRVVTNNPTLPVGHMRVLPFAGPYADGRRFSSETGWYVEYNGRVERQGTIGPCGPSR